MKRWTIVAILAVAVSGCAGSKSLGESCSERTAIRRVICEADHVSAFLLRSPGNPAIGSICPGSGFRGYAIRLPAVLTAHNWSLLESSLGDAEGMDCGKPPVSDFRPEIGFRAQSGVDTIEILVSFESDSWIWWLNGFPVDRTSSGLRCARGSLLEIVVSTFPEEKAFNQYWGSN